MRIAYCVVRIAYCVVRKKWIVAYDLSITNQK
jgi:hypothetical protein